MLEVLLYGALLFYNKNKSLHTMKKLVFATNNPHKIKEVQAMLPQDIQLVSLEAIGCQEEIPETADTIEDNAILKAKYIKDNYGYDVFADDTGLEIEALNNEPGVRSARYAGEHKNSLENMQLVLQKMKKQTNRKARFKTIFALYIGKKLHLFEGIVQGFISQNPKGENGFGYDPIFIPNGYEQTFAEISCQEKNTISHRAKATQQLVTFLKQF
ncbi:non-canonical purine NTP pyrophosphatase [Capnocytophaga catalasegens]|uniref:dITP/XTP pyrophosphatase n=2 Tax=Capnocytophaga catalasegens TaxID=1004260 RepID=A0AAV5AR58_9FLAO|nr:non-canonical purine NTP pyrophosphatase [Capnocytophaga catalasegens]GJM49766.1 non-canonical purine NTP pyrophosphatase [Capnocytophaga catalasegens]GJM52831.1 non-canonical purine NTP pyrophosphatase [Capnocytophaga catalasegens]